MEISRVMKFEREAAAAQITDHFGARGVTKVQPTADPRFLARVDETKPQATPGFKKLFEQKHLDLTATGLGAAQPRGKNFGIIEHQQVARIEEIAERGKYAVHDLAGLTTKHEQARSFPFATRHCRDQRARQFVVEFVEIHRNKNPQGARYAVPPAVLIQGETRGGRLSAQLLSRIFKHPS